MLLFAEKLPPVSNYVRQLTAMPDDIHLLEYPIYREAWENGEYLYRQTIHGKKMFNGMSIPAAMTPQYFALLDNSALLLDLESASNGVSPIFTPPDYRAWIAEADVDLMIIHAGSVAPDNLQRIIPFLTTSFGDPIYDDDREIVFSLR